MPQPTVSVVIPAFRVTAYIAETLDSVLAQTFQDLEIIVVNDGCPDTPGLRAALGPYRHRIHYIEQPQGGAAEATQTPPSARRQASSSPSSTATILWAPTFLAEQIAILAREPDVVSSGRSQPFGLGAGTATLITMQPPPPSAT